MYSNQQQLSAGKASAMHHDLSRTSSASSYDSRSPVRPPRSERRRSSAASGDNAGSPGGANRQGGVGTGTGTGTPGGLQMSSPLSLRPDYMQQQGQQRMAATSPTPSGTSYTSPVRSPPPALSGLSVVTSAPLQPIRAGSTPVTPHTHLESADGYGGAYSPRQAVASPTQPVSAGLASPNRPGFPPAATAPSSDRMARTDTGRYSYASSSSSSVPPSPSVQPVAAFTAGMSHAYTSPGMGPLKIESTTGSKATVIKGPTRSKSRTSSRASSAYGGGGISSEDVFGKGTAHRDDDETSNTSSRRSGTGAGGGRRKSLSISSFTSRKSGKGKESDDKGIRSSNQTAASPRTDSPSLANMLSGLRRGGDSVPPSPSLSMRSSSSASVASSSKMSRHGSASASASGNERASDASEAESLVSNASRRSTGSAGRAARLANAFRRKTDAEREEDAEHLRALAELRLRALALASEPDPADAPYAAGPSAAARALSPEASRQRENAELLVRDMQKNNNNNNTEARHSAIPLNRQSSSATTSSSYSQRFTGSPASPRHPLSPSLSGNNADPILHIRSPSRQLHPPPDSQVSAASRGLGIPDRDRASINSEFPRSISSSAYSSENENEGGDSFANRTASATASALFGITTTDDISEDDEERSARLAESRRRSTLVPASSSSQSHSQPHSSAHSPTRSRCSASGSGSGSGSPTAERRIKSPTLPATKGSRRASGLWLTKDSFDGRDLPQVQDSGDEADLEPEVDPELLERRRSTLKAGVYSGSPFGVSGRQISPKHSKIPLPSSPPPPVQPAYPATSTHPTSGAEITSSSGEDAYHSAGSAYAPPARTSSRPISPTISPTVSPLRFRNNSYPRNLSTSAGSERAESPAASSPGAADTTFTLANPGPAKGNRNREYSISSRHTREGVASSTSIFTSASAAADVDADVRADEVSTRLADPHPQTQETAARPVKIVDELNQAINAAMYDTRRSPPSPKTSMSSRFSPTAASFAKDLPVSPGDVSEQGQNTELQAQETDPVNISPRTSRTPSLASPPSPTRPLHHRRTSSADGSALPHAAPVRPIHHRKTSSSDFILSRPPLSPSASASATASSSASAQTSRSASTTALALGPVPRQTRSSSTASIPSLLSARSRQPSQPRLPSHTETYMALDVDKMLALLQRNKPLPRAALIKDDLKKCRSAGERAVMYAQKINELAACESGLSVWIAQIQNRSLGSPRAANYARSSLRKGSDATFRNMSVRSASPQPFMGHATRDENQSDAPFPLRKGSQDVYRARDITQRAPSVAPSTMVPSTIPYPGVYDNTQTLRTHSSLSHHSTGSGQTASTSTGSGWGTGSFASAALNAAGLPSRVGFFGLGRKSSKRLASSGTGSVAGSQRHRMGLGMMSDAGSASNNSGSAGLSISAPLQAPPGQLGSASVGRTTGLRPSGPRPSLSSSSSELPVSQPSSQSIRSLASQQYLPTIPSGFSSSASGNGSLGGVSMQTSSSQGSGSLAGGGGGGASPNPASASASASVGAGGYSSAVITDQENLTAMADILPLAPRDVLARYLAQSNGDHLAAIGRYLDDERAGRL